MPGFELFGDLERQEVNDVLNTGVLMRYGFDALRQNNWKAKTLEKELQRQFRVKHAQLVSSGTAALSVALASCGIGHGDEVIMPTFTFVATFEAIMMVGAIPVIVDIDDTLGLDPSAVEEAITSKTKAIMAVHMCGAMCDMGALQTICKTHQLLLIEDACQAIGGTYRGEYLGTIGDIGCFSFDFVKTITCGEGGAVLTNSPLYYSHADAYSDHGHDHIGSDRGAETHPFLGYNFRISELHAAVGLGQIKRLPFILERQKKYADIIRKKLSEIDEITFRKIPEGGEESHAFLNFLLPNLNVAEQVSKALKINNIGPCFHYYDNNWHYIKKWHHLKEVKTLYPISKEMKETLNMLQQKRFDSSDYIISRNISCLIKVSWKEEEVHSYAFKMVSIIKGVLTSNVIK